MEHILTIISGIAVLGAGWLVALRISAWMGFRAICSVARIFRDKGAVQPQTAVAPEELGFFNRPLLQLRRDYRPYAFQVMVQTEIVQPTPDGRFFLSERKLSEARGLTCGI